MSYHIYTTRGIVLAERPIREADRIYTILTCDLGLIRAMAIGVRKEASKLRGNIEPFSLTSVSLVRGREYWRLTSAEYIQNIPSLPSVARPLSLLSQLVQGEAPHPELFGAIEETILSSDHEDKMFEVGLVSKILLHLGYLKASDMDLNKESLIKAINNGIQASHL
ncbi:MAG: DNA repair protein RecO [Candidatus Zambryskibacteria bacterium CG11_big_fil_rev_8_21_14_0_20_42_18]|uniref:DNA repair protein RecO n=1 Tax=Candidatus Zambryskibacteria bacterium CG_4_9_14_3_um_filter_42_15 TaxID=1975112 RepID=A0A2M7WSD8_9BACT|nr:MAG: DNA repair protein RecO [Candidatus Zambryskibacteria bacterium CG11_big_fil_rev_8_21_14_0_20_42_18]PJA32919.1 MAG: DNA repair protein RecO [Candidatus Zambryskibacteria bacterium CG_4_9_14_3_um_filter_42_15]